MATNKVFVYGSLKRGFHNHTVMEDAGGKYLTTAVLCGARMHNLGSYPGIQRSADTEETVMGELFEVPEQGMDELDALEGHPRFYMREIVTVLGGDNDVHFAWVYFYPHALRAHHLHVTNGEWSHSDVAQGRR